MDDKKTLVTDCSAQQVRVANCITDKDDSYQLTFTSQYNYLKYSTGSFPYKVKFGQ